MTRNNGNPLGCRVDNVLRVSSLRRVETTARNRAEKQSRTTYLSPARQARAIASWCLTRLLCVGTLAEALAGRASWLLPEARCSAMLLITLLTATLAGRSSLTLFGPRGCSTRSDRWDRDSALNVRSLPPLAGRCLKAGALPGRTRLAPSGRSARVSVEVMVRERP